MTERLALRVPEVARAVGLGRNRVYDLVNRGVIPSKRIGKSIIVAVADIERWLQERDDDGDDA